MFTRAVRVATISGVRIHLDWGLSVLLLMISANLGAGLLPIWHPTWPVWLSWTLAVSAAVLFLLSVLVHELSHALIGRIFGVPINDITLFIFGGAAQLDEEPESARAEFFMAVAGPLVSLAIGALCLLGSLPDLLAANVHAANVGQALATLSPRATLLLWLGPTNLLVGAFNLLPGFPLDGGRILRSVLWGLLRDLVRATRVATRIGQGLATTLVVLGGFMALGNKIPYVGGGLAQGLWTVFVGWFLHRSAVASYQRLLLTNLLREVPVAELMRSQVQSVDPNLDLLSFERQFLLVTDQRAFPVVEGERLVGLICLSDLEHLPREEWATTLVRRVMVPAPKLATVEPEDTSAKALVRLTRRNVNQVPVVKDGRLAGLLRRRDIARWLERRATRASA